MANDHSATHRLFRPDPVAIGTPHRSTRANRRGRSRSSTRSHDTAEPCCDCTSRSTHCIRRRTANAAGCPCFTAQRNCTAYCPRGRHCCNKNFVPLPPPTDGTGFAQPVRAPPLGTSQAVTTTTVRGNSEEAPSGGATEPEESVPPAPRNLGNGQHMGAVDGHTGATGRRIRGGGAGDGDGGDGDDGDGGGDGGGDLGGDGDGDDGNDGDGDDGVDGDGEGGNGTGDDPEEGADADDGDALAVDFVPDEGADLEGFEATPADLLIQKVYGDHIHSNDGTHLTGGIATDPSWQSRWIRLVQHSPSRYSVPTGKVGRRFISILTSEFQLVRERRWNSERLIVFIVCILQRAQGVIRSRDIRARLRHRMDLWEQGHIAALVDDTESLLLERSHPVVRAHTPESEARVFNSKVLSGRLRSAVRGITARDGGGVYQPDDLDSKTGRPVLEVLQEKHPDLREPPDIGTATGSFEPVDDADWRKPIPVVITPDIVETVASRLSGAAGVDGVDSVEFRHWLLRFGPESTALRTELARWTEWWGNDHPPWAAYRALMANRLVPLDKRPGVRPIGIGSIIRRTLAKCLIKASGSQATAACGNLNLCAGLPSGIEAAVHAVHKRTRADLVVPPPPNGPPPARPPDPPVDVDPDDPPVPGPPTGTLLVDARNGFNELNRKAMLWTVRNLWPNGARFAFNCYRHFGQLILRRRGADCAILLSREGVTQGDPLSMLLYGLALIPLADSLRQAEPEVLQPWYADDAAMVGPVDAIARAMRLLERQGPARGYFPEPEKSIFVPTKPHEADRCRDALNCFGFRHRAGQRYLGGFVGSATARDEWLAPQIQDWIFGIEKLALVARRFPQTAYAGLTKSLQNEWTYLQRVVPGADAAMAPLEDAITRTFLPALFQEQPEDRLHELRVQISLAVKAAGLGIHHPVHCGGTNHATSLEVTGGLVRSLLNGQHLNTATYIEEGAMHRTEFRKARIMADKASLKDLQEAYPREAKRMERATCSGSWLTVSPDRINGTDLNETEFRDSLRLRFGMTPVNLPERCDGCHQRFSVGHAMSCKKGGLILLRHNDIASEWHEMCANAISPSAVTDEPLIHLGQTGRAGNAPAATTQVENEIRGDLAVHGFWKRGTTAIFDIRVTDLDNPSQRGLEPSRVLARHEAEKKRKYSHHCERQRRHFTPLVFSVDGLLGKECAAAQKCLASKLASKWKRTYSEVCGFVRSRMSIALVRSASRCLRWDRNPSARPCNIAWASGSGLSLYH